MKIEIEKSEYDRLKSREEKLMAYYEWFVDKENDLVTVEDIVNKNIELMEENKKLREELEKTNELLSNVARCSEQYRGKMTSVMEELKMFLYKD